MNISAATSLSISLDNLQYSLDPWPTTAFLLATGLAGLTAAGRGHSLH